MKFKVGDRVKFVKSIEIHSNKVKLGGCLLYTSDAADD